MSFIGADGQDHLIKSLKAQVQSKDGELASVRNELAKCKQSLEEEKKQRMGLEYQVSIFGSLISSGTGELTRQINMDAQGAETTGKNTVGMKNEIAQLKQNLFNRETSLNTANETIKRLEKDKSGLEYDLQIASASSGDATRLLNDQKTKLQNEVKTLKQELQRKESEEARTKTAGAKVAAECGIPVSNIPRLRRPAPASNIFGASTPSSEAGPSRRCSTSLANNREVELTKEVAVLKTQVAGQKVKVDKLINERIAVERGAKKKEEELKDRIEAMTDELDFYRSNAGAAGPDPKKVKQLEEEIAKLKAANEGLAKDLEALQAQKSGLDEEVKRVNELEAELERARTAATVATPLIDEEASRALQSEIDTLRAQVAEQQSAIATAASSSAPESDRVLDLTKQLRQLKRDNDMARHLVKTAEDERDEMEAENAELSKRLQSVQTGGSAVDDGELNALRVALKEAEDNATEYREKLDCLELLVKDEQAAKTSLQAEIEATKNALSDAETEARLAQEALDRAVEEASVLQTQLVEAQKSAEEAQSSLTAAQSELQVAVAEAQSESMSALRTAEDRVKELERDLNVKNAELAEMTASSEASVAKERDLQRKFAASAAALGEMEAKAFGHKEERDQAREKSNDMERRIADVQAKLEEAEQVRDATFSEIGHIEAALQATQTELEDAQAALAKQTAEVERLSDTLQSSAADNVRLEQKLAELEDSLANRSTETEAQHRQEEVFQLKDDLESAQRDRRKLQVAECERSDEVQAKQSEIAEARVRIGQLEELVATLEAQLIEAKATPPIEVKLTAQPKEEVDASHAHLLHGMIERLRTERDELRQTASFVKHEHRFALQATEADRAATAEKLQHAQREAKNREMEFSKKLEELQSLQTQITDTAVELEDLRSRLATQSDAEQRGSDLSSKIDLLQLDLEKVQEERNSLKEEVEHLGRVRDAAVNDLDAFRYQSTEALKREAKLQQDLNRLRSEREEGRDVVSAATLTLRSPVEMAFSRPTSANGVHDVERRRLGHSRRQSLADLKGEQPARDAAAMVNVLQAQLKSEEERVKSLQNKLHAEIARREAEVQRVQRRELTIAQLREEKRVAEERIVVPEVDADVTVDDGDAAQIASLQIQIESLQTASAASLAQHDADKSAMEQSLQQAVAQRDELSERLAALQFESKLQLEAADAKYASLSAEMERDVATRDQLSSEIEILRAERTADADLCRTTNARIQELEAELEELRDQTASITAERDEMQARSSADQDSIRIEMEELFSSKHTLEKKVYKLEGVERALQLQVETLEAEAAASTEAREQERVGESAERAKVDVLLKGKMAELATAQTTLAQVQEAALDKDRRVQYLTELVDGLTLEVEQWQADHTAYLHNEHIVGQRVAAAIRDKEALELEKQQLSVQLANMRYSEDEAAQLAIDRNALQATLAAGAAELLSVREALKAAEAAAAEKEELVKQVEQMEERISSLTVEAATSAQLRSEKDGFATQITTLEARIAQMSGAEADLRVQLDAARSAQDSASSKLVIKLEESTKAHAELAAQLATINEAKDMLETTAAAYTKSIEQLEGRIANLETTEADLQRQLDIAHKQRADSELAGSRQTEQLEQARTASDEQAATLRELTAKLQEAEERLASAASGSAEMEALEADKKSLQSEIDDTRARLADAETSIADLSNRLEESQRMSSELQAARHVLAGDLEAARMHASRLEEERADMVPSNDLVNVTEELAAMKRDLAMAQDSAHEPERLVMSKESIIAQLRNANEEYSRKLTSMTAASLSAVDKEEVSELKERIEHLELALEQRNAECEAYDDKLAEASSALKSLKRKHDKMVREVKKKERDDELARITALNVKLSKPTAEEAAPRPVAAAARAGPASLPTRAAPTMSAPAPIPASAPAAAILTPSAVLKPSVAPNATIRPPLRKVSAFDEQMPASFATAFSPLVGTKRGRETDDAFKPIKADAIMLPPSAPAVSTAFKLGAMQPRTNAFADTGKENAAKMSEVPIAGAGLRRPTVPLRNVFSPEP